MTPLKRRLLRDLAQMKGQVAVVAPVMVCGLALMIMSRSRCRQINAASILFELVSDHLVRGRSHDERPQIFRRNRPAPRQSRGDRGRKWTARELREWTRIL